MERGQHGGQQAELDQDHQPAGPAEGGKAAAGTSAQGAGLVPYVAEARPLLLREGGGRRFKGPPQGFEPGPERGLFLFQLPQR